VIFQRKVARPRSEAVHAGWNDATWGRPHRQVESALAQLYESGYAGGLSFRHKQQLHTSAQDVLGPLVASRGAGLSPTNYEHAKAWL
jgi:hypothetical protein